MPSSVLSHKSPFEVLFHSLSDFSLLKVFGCQCFPWLKPYTAHKLQPRSVACMFLGYHPTIEGYRCLEPITGKIYISKHVLFNETCFPFAVSSTPISSSSSSLPTLHSFF